MNFNKSQKKYIKKHIKKESTDIIAKHLSVSDSEIQAYLKSNLNLRIHDQVIKGKNEDEDNVFNSSKGFNFKKFILINRWQIFFLLGLVFLSYANSIGNSFVSDDRGIIINTPIWDARNILANPYPFLRQFLYLLLYKIGGLNPVLFHISNIIFHAGVVLLIYLVLSIMKKPRVGMLAAVFFAVHPFLVESVTWVSSGVYPQYSFFFLLALLFYILPQQNIKKYALSISFYLLALLSSEKSVSLFLIFPLFELCFGNFKKFWKKLIPYFILTGFWVLFYIKLVIVRAGLFEGQQSIDPTLYNPFLQVPIAITSYLQLLFWPDGLTLYHSEMIFSQGEYILRVLFLIGFLVFTVYSFKRYRFIFFWLSFFIITLLPTINPFVHAWVVAERYAYLGTLGIFASLAFVVEKLFESYKTKTIAVSVITIIVILLLIRTITRNSDWSSEDTLWLSAVRTSPSSSQNHNNLGDYYGRHGDLKNSIAEFKRAIELKPNYADAYHNLGNAYRDSGSLDLAIKSYEKALSIEPSIWQSYQNIAAIYIAEKNYNKAIIYLQKGLVSNPKNLNFFVLSAIVYFKQGDKDKANYSINKALEIDPQSDFAKEIFLRMQSNTLE